MNLIIAGSRNYDDYDVIKRQTLAFINEIREDIENITIVCGDQWGVDYNADRFAREHRLICHRYPALWHLYDKAAGPIRNKRMAIVSHACIVFWDGTSPGSADMIRQAREQHLIVKEVIVPITRKRKS